MGDDYHERNLQLIQRSLNLFLVAAVQCGSGFIKNQYLWLFDDGSGYCDTLFLPSRKSTELRIQTDSLDEVPCLGHFQCSNNFLLLAEGIGDGLADGRTNQNRFLPNISNLLAIVHQIEGLEVDLTLSHVEVDGSADGIVVPHYQTDQS